MSAFLLAVCLALPVVSDDAVEAKPGPLQRALDRFAFEYELWSVRLDVQLLLWHSKWQWAVWEMEFKERTGMTMEEFLRDAERRRIAEMPAFLRVGKVLYEDVADFAGPGRARFEHGDCDPLRRGERPSRR